MHQHLHKDSFPKLSTRPAWSDCLTEKLAQQRRERRQARKTKR